MVKSPPINAGDAREASSIPGGRDSLEEGIPWRRKWHPAPEVPEVP